MKFGGGAPLNACHTSDCATTIVDAARDFVASTPRSACNRLSFEEIGSKVPRAASTGFTLTEILLAIAIVGIIAALVLPAIVTNYQNRALDIGFEREIKTISGAVKNLAVSENKVDFYSTMMYTASASDSYEETSGKFVKKYLKVSKYCGDSNGDCFAEKYYNYNDTTHKKEIYEPVFKGACASLKNGASICITPQTSSGSISGLIDINGKKGPNIFGRDLRSFTIDSQVEKTSLSKGTSDVLSTPESDLEPKKPEEPEVPTPTPQPDGPCAESSISKACCDTKTVKKGDACCIHYQSQVGHPCYEVPVKPDVPEIPQDKCETALLKSKFDWQCKFNPSTFIGQCYLSFTKLDSILECNYPLRLHVSMFGGGQIMGSYYELGENKTGTFEYNIKREIERYYSYTNKKVTNLSCDGNGRCTFLVDGMSQSSYSEIELDIPKGSYSMCSYKRNTLTDSGSRTCNY